MLFQIVPPSNITDLVGVLTWLAAGVGSVSVMGAFFSYLAANWATWETFPSAVKKFVPLLFSVLLGVGATILLKYTPLIELMAPWFALIVTTCIAYAASQKTYMGTIKPLKLQQRLVNRQN
jgi:hypothetical protein